MIGPRGIQQSHAHLFFEPTPFGLDGFDLCLDFLTHHQLEISDRPFLVLNAVKICNGAKGRPGVLLVLRTSGDLENFGDRRRKTF